MPFNSSERHPLSCDLTTGMGSVPLWTLRNDVGLFSAATQNGMRPEEAQVLRCRRSMLMSIG